jgi:hypothetical protein
MLPQVSLALSAPPVYNFSITKYILIPRNYQLHIASATTK